MFELGTPLYADGLFPTGETFVRPYIRRVEDGAAGGSRTRNILNGSQVLCRLSYCGESAHSWFWRLVFM